MNNFNIYAIQTARGGSKSILKKNYLIMNSKPLYLHNIDYAKKSKYIKDVYITTDMKEIIKDKKTNIILRPNHLLGDDAPLDETMMHAIDHIETEKNEKVDIVVLLFGNNIGAYTEDMDRAIEILINDKSLDSVVSVGVRNMFSPIRSWKLDENNKVSNFLGKYQNEILKNKNEHQLGNKDCLGETYFMNGSFFIIRKEVIERNDSDTFLTFIGNKIYGYIQDPKVIELDAQWQLSVMETN